MKNSEMDEQIVATIPWNLKTQPLNKRIRFVVFPNGKLGEISMRTLNKGEIRVKAKITNIPAAIRRYLFHIRARYLKLEMKLEELEITRQGQIIKIDKERKRIKKISNRLQPRVRIAPKEMITMYQQLSIDIEKLDFALVELEGKSIRISQWAQKLGYILIAEQQRIENIINSTARQLMRIYKEVIENGLSNRLVSFFEDYNCNLMNGLKTIHVNFTERADDLERIRKIIRMMEIIPDKYRNNKEIFADKIYDIIDTIAPLINTEIKTKINGTWLIMRGGNVQQSR